MRVDDVPSARADERLWPTVDLLASILTSCELLQLRNSHKALTGPYRLALRYLP